LAIALSVELASQLAVFGLNVTIRSWMQVVPLDARARLRATHRTAEQIAPPDVVENLFSADRLPRSSSHVIAIDALKRANLEPDPRGLNVRQDHWTQHIGTAVGLNCYGACGEQDC
jgi:hypothetical protein